MFNQIIIYISVRIRLAVSFKTLVCNMLHTGACANAALLTYLLSAWSDYSEITKKSLEVHARSVITRSRKIIGNILASIQRSFEFFSIDSKLVLHPFKYSQFLWEAGLAPRPCSPIGFVRVIVCPTCTTSPPGIKITLPVPGRKPCLASETDHHICLYNSGSTMIH